MTGILTKQNVIDRALVGGGGGGSGDGSSGLLNTLHVYHNATFDGPTRFENFDGASVTFKSQPVFDNDLTVMVNDDPVTMTDVCGMIDTWSDATKQVSKAITTVDKRYNQDFDTLLDCISDLQITIDNHIKEHPDIRNDNDNDNDNPQTDTQSMIEPQVLNQPVNLLANEVVEQPDVEQPDDEQPIDYITINDINQTYDTLITSFTKSLNHFENNDNTIYQIATEHDKQLKILDKGFELTTLSLNSIDESITNINAALDEDEKNIDKHDKAIETINTTLTQCKDDIDIIDNDLTSLSASVAYTVDVNDKITTVDVKVDKLQSSLKALVDQIQSLDRSQENHLDNNSSSNIAVFSDNVSDQPCNTNDTNQPQTYSMLRTRAAAVQNEDSELNDTVVNDVMVDWITTMNDSFNHFEDNDKQLMIKFDDYYTSTECDNKFAVKGEIPTIDLTGYYNKTESDGKYALKTAIPTDYVSSSSLTTTLNNYALKTYTYSKTESDGKYVNQDNVIKSTDTESTADDNHILTALNTINHINNAQFWVRNTSNVIIPKNSNDYIKGNIFAIRLYFNNDTKRYVSDIACSDETSDSNNSLSTTAFVHKCVNDSLSQCDSK